MKMQDTQKLSNLRPIISPTRISMRFFFLATNAPGRSAFNKLERQMVKFSQELSVAVLHHNKFMSYLNYKMETIDPELENLCMRDRS